MISFTVSKFPIPMSLMILFLLLFPCSILGQTSNIISIGSSLLADSTNSSWTSPSGLFAFGFRNIGPSTAAAYILSIWFNQIPGQAIIWSANRDQPAPLGSRIHLTSNSFELTDPGGKQIWSASFRGIEFGYAEMLETGNFVLARKDNNSVFLWESFDNPTDTILPTQKLSLGMKLVSSFSETNYSTGRFEVNMQVNGNLAFYTRMYPIDAVYSSYLDVGNGFELMYNKSGNIYLIQENGTVVMNIMPVSNSEEGYHLRTILEYDGVLRQYWYPKSNKIASENPMKWSVLSSTPPNICLISQQQGPGACGYNSYCKLDDQRATCTCLPGHERFNEDDPLSGCRPSFELQRCSEENQEVGNFHLVVMDKLNWPFNDYEHYGDRSEDWCREACLRDCYCYVAIYNDGRSCYKKRNPVSNGKELSPSEPTKAFVKVRRYNFSTNDASFPGASERGTILIILGTTMLGSSVLLIVVFFTIFSFKNKNNKNRGGIVQKYQNLEGDNLISFSFKELEDATNGFKDELGRGASSIVFKGVLESRNGVHVAVKKIDRLQIENIDHEFKSEVNAIGRTNHKNLVHLRGYCNEGQNRLLVYEYMTKGCLADFVFGTTWRPSWNMRMQIAIGIARGLNYLHEECSMQIIHCDIKPQNILLDENYTPRISDFGLAKLLMTNQSRTLTAIRGTRGYVAPEWFRNMPITAKVDVYSFGILLLELVCCRKNVEGKEDYGMESAILTDWACDCLEFGKIHDMVMNDDDEAKDDLKRVKRFVMTAIWCIQEDPFVRPTMKKVSQMLEGTVEVPSPPDPST